MSALHDRGVKRGGRRPSPHLQVPTAPRPAHGAASSASWGAAAALLQPTASPAAVPAAPRPVPISHYEDSELSLPSYAAFRRSAGTAAFTSAATAAGQAHGQGPSASPAPPTAALAAGPADGGALSGLAGGRAGVAGLPAAGRTFPTAYQPRSLGSATAPGGPSASSASLDAAAQLGLPAPLSASALSGGRGLGAGSSSYSLSSYSAMGPSPPAEARGPRGVGGGPGGTTAAAAGWQPLVFNMAGMADGGGFRSGGAPVRSVLSAENSMSLAAHTSAATAAPRR